MDSKEDEDLGFTADSLAKLVSGKIEGGAMQDGGFPPSQSSTTPAKQDQAGTASSAPAAAAERSSDAELEDSLDGLLPIRAAMNQGMRETTRSVTNDESSSAARRLSLISDGLRGEPQVAASSPSSSSPPPPPEDDDDAAAERASNQRDESMDLQQQGPGGRDAGTHQDDGARQEDLEPAASASASASVVVSAGDAAGGGGGDKVDGKESGAPRVTHQSTDEAAGGVATVGAAPGRAGESTTYVARIEANPGAKPEADGEATSGAATAESGGEAAAAAAAAARPRMVEEPSEQEMEAVSSILAALGTKGSTLIERHKAARSLEGLVQGGICQRLGEPERRRLLVACLAEVQGGGAYACRLVERCLVGLALAGDDACMDMCVGMLVSESERVRWGGCESICMLLGQVGESNGEGTSAESAVVAGDDGGEGRGDGESGGGRIRAGSEDSRNGGFDHGRVLRMIVKVADGMVKNMKGTRERAEELKMSILESEKERDEIISVTEVRRGRRRYASAKQEREFEDLEYKLKVDGEELEKCRSKLSKMEAYAADALLSVCKAVRAAVTGAYWGGGGGEVCEEAGHAMERWVADWQEEEVLSLRGGDKASEVRRRCLDVYRAVWRGRVDGGGRQQQKSWLMQVMSQDRAGSVRGAAAMTLVSLSSTRTEDASPVKEAAADAAESSKSYEGGDIDDVIEVLKTGMRDPDPAASKMAGKALAEYAGVAAAVGEAERVVSSTGGGEGMASLLVELRAGSGGGGGDGGGVGGGGDGGGEGGAGVEDGDRCLEALVGMLEGRKASNRRAASREIITCCARDATAVATVLKEMKGRKSCSEGVRDAAGGAYAGIGALETAGGGGVWRGVDSRVLSSRDAAVRRDAFYTAAGVVVNAKDQVAAKRGEEILDGFATRAVKDERREDSLLRGGGGWIMGARLQKWQQQGTKEGGGEEEGGGILREILVGGMGVGGGSRRGVCDVSADALKSVDPGVRCAAASSIARAIEGETRLWRQHAGPRLISSSELGRAGLFSGEPLGWGRPPQTASLLESLAHLATGDPDATVRSRAQNLLNELDSRGFLTKDGAPLPSCAAQKYAEEIESAPAARYSIHQGPYYPHVWDAVHPSSEPPSLKEVRGAGSRREVPGWQAIQAGLAWGRR